MRPALPAVHVEWEPPNHTHAASLRQAGLYHAVPDADIEEEDRLLPWEAGKPMCSWRGALQPAPAALFPPEVTCCLCAHQIQRLGLEVRAA
jgi:hypothetical protein